MMYLYVSNKTGVESYQSENGPTEKQIDSVSDELLEIYRFNTDLERFEKYNIDSNIDPEDDDPEDDDNWQELMNKF